MTNPVREVWVLEQNGAPHKLLLDADQVRWAKERNDERLVRYVPEAASPAEQVVQGDWPTCDGCGWPQADCRGLVGRKCCPDCRCAESRGRQGAEGLAAWEALAKWESDHRENTFEFAFGPSERFCLVAEGDCEEVRSDGATATEAVIDVARTLGLIPLPPAAEPSSPKGGG